MKGNVPFRASSSNKSLNPRFYFEALVAGAASLAACLFIIVLGVWVARLLAINDANDRAKRIASVAAQAVTAGLHADPEPELPDASVGVASIFKRIDDAIQGQPHIVRIRRFDFVGDLPVQVHDPRVETKVDTVPLGRDVVDRLLAGVQFVTNRSEPWFSIPGEITAFAPVYASTGQMHGAVAVDLEPVALRARLLFLKLGALAVAIISLIFSFLVMLRVLVSRRLAAATAKELGQARQLEMLSIQALGELLYSMDVSSGRINWRVTSDGFFGGKHFTPPDTIEGWTQYIHPDDRKISPSRCAPVPQRAGRIR